MKQTRIVFWFGLAKAFGTAALKLTAWRDAAGARGMRLIMDASVAKEPPSQ